MDILNLVFIGFVMYLGFISIPSMLEQHAEN